MKRRPSHMVKSIADISTNDDLSADDRLVGLVV